MTCTNCHDISQLPHKILYLIGCFLWFIILSYKARQINGRV